MTSYRISPDQCFHFLESGFVAGNIAKVLEGQCIGTLFHRDAHSWIIHDEFGAREMAVAARECSIRLQVKYPIV